MTWGVSEIARLLGVDRNLVKTWAYRFKEHLSEKANPPKGSTRAFTDDDVRVMAYVFEYWEDDPDIENIEAGLNCGDHQDERYDGILASITPLFQDPPEGLDEAWRHGGLVGGWFAVDNFELADAYKLAGDTLVKTALSEVDVHELLYPIFYSYRHALELYLKAILSPKNKRHDLQALLQRLGEYLNREHAASIPAWFNNVVLEFAEFDPESTTFRFSEEGVFSRRTGDSGEFWIDLVHLREVMGWIAESFQRIKAAQRAKLRGSHIQTRP
jgi:hypothetical protein